MEVESEQRSQQMNDSRKTEWLKCKMDHLNGHEITPNIGLEVQE
jgi:hypothetical protein